MISNYYVRIINDSDSLTSWFCQICSLAKQKRLTFHVSTSSSNKIFDLLHMDIWRPLAITSMYGYR